jgi:hypothetical protein
MKKNKMILQMEIIKFSDHDHLEFELSDSDGVKPLSRKLIYCFDCHRSGRSVHEFDQREIQELIAFLQGALEENQSPKNQ